MLEQDKIFEIAVGVDEHFRKFESMQGTMREIKSSLDMHKNSQDQAIMYLLNNIAQDILEIKEQLKKYGLPQASKYEKELQIVKELANSAEWPDAVDPTAICNSDDMAEERAESILDLLVGVHLKDKRFLDYGCGEGHTIPKALQREAKLALGYDVALKNLIFDVNNFTTKFEEVKNKAPYDVILMHDVLDHIVMVDPIEALLQAKSVLSTNGRIYVRNHPWSSRHGGHLYMQNNKAFLHLAYDSIELSRVHGLQADHNIKVVTPLETYRFWFEKAGLKIVAEIPIREKVENFFLNPSPINDRLKKHFSNPECMENCLEISFVEYVLEPIDSNQQIF
jgi:2-polyprenyl-3-methyl-5-hydroxy-6-metoxy-1,4-benzoquinol methylase